jgi:hypothetical protein
VTSRASSAAKTAKTRCTVLRHGHGQPSGKGSTEGGVIGANDAPTRKEMTMAATNGQETRQLIERFVAAHEHADIPAIMTLLAEDRAIAGGKHRDGVRCARR